MDNSDHYDVIIVGQGAAAFSAALYAARYKMKTLMIGEEFGGETLTSSIIENYPGYLQIDGLDLMLNMKQQVEALGVQIIDGRAERIGREDGRMAIAVGEQAYRTGSVILAVGRERRKLGLPREKELTGKGLAYCATCDAPLFSGKDVAVVGGGNAALDAALQLSQIGKRIYVINISTALGGDEVTQEKIRSMNNVEILNNSETIEILGDKFVSGIKIKDKLSGAEKTINVQGVFIEIGSVPSTIFAKDFLEMNALNEIIINCRSETNVPGVFAAGDVTNGPAKQIIAAAGDGCKAALAAYEYLMRSR